MSQKKASVHGLQNIGALIGRAAAPQVAPNRVRSTVDGIAKITSDKLIAQVDVGDPRGAAANMCRHYIEAGIRDAYNLGHANALEQNSAVDKMLDKQYEVRTGLLTPTVVCAVMEQSGLSSMTLDLARMSTVFERMDIQYTLDADTNVMTYTARPIGSFHDAALGVPFIRPEEVDPTDPRDDLESDVRHQVEDIEQTAGPISIDAEQFEAKDYGYDGPNSSEQFEDKI